MSARLYVVVVGARGRLGRLVLDEVQLRTEVELAGAVNRSGLRSDPEAVVVVGPDIDDVLAHCPQRPLVVVDVTTPGSTATHARACARAGVPYVCATTGLSAAEQQALDEASTQVPVLVAANLSPGAHLVAILAQQAARALGDTDVEIIEIHHRKKKDAPSGTALMLADAVKAGRAAIPHKTVHSRDGADCARQPGDIGVVAVRGGDVVGEHTVSFFADGERVELVHKVSDRRIFAAGALDAATWLMSRKPGRYGMPDVLKSRLALP
ncbi:MAG TPA: 4-hydroxy-tetrahydrodipicolinate reductase [Myxococcota bacterium]